MSRRRKKGTASSAMPVAIIMFVLTLFVLFAYQYVKAMQSVVETDKSTNCRSDGFFPRDSVLLLDATEGLSEAQLLHVTNELDRVVRDSIIYERFTVYFLKDDPERFQPRLVVCNPGDGQNLDPNKHNLKRLLKTWQNSFREPLIQSLQELADVTPATSSPIMEMLKFVSLRTFSRSTAIDKRLILVSDMVEHTNSYSQYRNKDLDFEKLSKAAYFREVRPRLDGVMIDVMYIERPALEKLQTIDHITRFWGPFVREFGGQINTINRVN